MRYVLLRAEWGELMETVLTPISRANVQRELLSVENRRQTANLPGLKYLTATRAFRRYRTNIREKTGLDRDRGESFIHRLLRSRRIRKQSTFARVNQIPFGSRVRTHVYSGGLKSKFVARFSRR